MENKTRKKSKKEKITTTKKILVLTWVTFLALVVLQILGFEVGIAMEIVGGAMTAIITIGYIWKSKVENKMKISYSMIDKLADKYGIENVINLLQDILRD